MIWAAIAFASVASVVIGVLLALRVRVPPVVTALVWLPVPGLVALIIQSTHSAALEASGQLPIGFAHNGYAGTVGEALLELEWVGAACVPALVFLVLGSCVGALRSGQKAWGLIGVVWLLVFALAAGLMRDYAFAMEVQPFPARLVAYLLLGGLAGLAVVGTDPKGSGPESAGHAGVGFVMAVLCLEISSTTLPQGYMYSAIASVSTEMIGALWANGASVAAPLEGRAQVSLIWGSTLALVGLGVASTPSGARRFGAVAAIPVLALAIGAFTSLSPHERFQAFDKEVRLAISPYPTADYHLPVSESARARAGLSTTLLASSREVRLGRRRVCDMNEAQTASGRTSWSVADREALGDALRREAKAIDDAEAGEGFFDEPPEVETPEAGGPQRAITLKMLPKLPWSVAQVFYEEAARVGFTDVRLGVYGQYGGESVLPLPPASRQARAGWVVEITDLAMVVHGRAGGKTDLGCDLDCSLDAPMETVKRLREQDAESGLVVLAVAPTVPVSRVVLAVDILRADRGRDAPVPDLAVGDLSWVPEIEGDDALPDAD